MENEVRVKVARVVRRPREAARVVKEDLAARWVALPREIVERAAQARVARPAKEAPERAVQVERWEALARATPERVAPAAREDPAKVD